MIDDRENPWSPVGREVGVTPPDDEPTLETATPAPDDDPTLENEPREAVGESTLETAVPKATGWASRLEQLTAAKREHRHQMVSRFWLAGAPVLILLVVAVVMLVVYGGQDAGGSFIGTPTTVERRQVEGSGVLLVVKDDVLSWVVVLHPWDSGGAVLAVPGITLLESEGAFLTLGDMYRKGDRQAVKAALAEALDVSVGPVAVVAWAAVRTALASARIEGFPSEASALGQGAAESVASALRSLVGAYVLDGDTSVWNDMQLGGEASEFMRAMGLDAASMAANAWVAGAVTGKVVDGDGFYYLEPDVEAAKSLLAVAVETAVVAVEIKDGAGIEGAARLAGGLLESGGFTLAPMSYAEGYPGVEKTQVVTTPGSADKARQVLALLGVGEIVEDKTLTADRILVILGKDFSGEPSTGAKGTD
jgi:hypothetical protein